jgi:hypothetical protein
MQVAIALTGSRPAGEDLLQAALERVLRKPRQVDSDTEGYLRRVLYNLAAEAGGGAAGGGSGCRCCGPTRTGRQPTAPT